MTSSPITTPCGEIHGCASSPLCLCFRRTFPRSRVFICDIMQVTRRDEPAARILWTVECAGGNQTTPARIDSVVPSPLFMRDPSQMCGGIIVLYMAHSGALTYQFRAELQPFGDVASQVPWTNQTCVSRLRWSKWLIRPRSGPIWTSLMPRVLWSDDHILRCQTQK